MASSIIHMAVANEINKKLKRKDNMILIGSIAPDISKIIGENKVRSHFLDDEKNDIPNIDRFLDKYEKNLSDDFVMGYFIHLYTDYLWFKYFIPEIYNHDMIFKLDGTIVKCDEDMFTKYLYNDYTNINITLLDEYNLDLSIFWNDPPKLNNIIEEIPMDRIDLIINRAAEIHKNAKLHKDLIFDIKNVQEFIKLSTELTLSKIEEIKKNR